MRKRPLYYVAILCLMASLILGYSKIAKADSTSVQNRLNYILSIYPTDSYFSVNGLACTHPCDKSCSNCNVLNIPARGNLPKGSDTVNAGAWTCYGFARYAFYYLNGGVHYNDSRNTTYTGKSHGEVYQYAKIGDYIKISGHQGVYISGDQSGFWMYESNYEKAGTNRVGYKTHRHTEDNVTIVHAYNYGNNDTDPPTISNVSVTNVSSAGYNVSCTVDDNKGVTRVAFPTWTTQNNQDDLVWFDGTISGNTATVWIDVRNHNNERDCTYITHIYAYDAAGNERVANTDQFSNLYVYVPSVDPTNYTITLDANGGVVSLDSLPVTQNQSNYYDISWNLPTYVGYEFDGWYTASSGGTQVYNKQGLCTNEGQYWSNNYYVYPGNVTLYAHWKQTYITPDSNILSVSPGNSFCETLFTWTTAANADEYDLYIYDPATYGNGEYLYWKKGIKNNYYYLLLPAGNYMGLICPVNKTFKTWSDSNMVEFTVASASAGSSGTLKTWREANNRLFCVYEKNCSWMEAREIANRDAGVFASVTDQSEQDAVAEAVAEFGGSCWLGAEAFHNDEFSWVDGDSFTYTHFDAGQPDHGAGYENCLEIVYDRGVWNDITNLGDASGSAADVRGYVLRCDPVSIIALPSPNPFFEGHVFTKDDLSVNVTFENGVQIETTEYTLEQSGTESGAQTLLISYGDISFSLDVELLSALDVILPADLTHIEEEAFAGIDAEVIEVPEGCVSIGERAFADCPNLRYVIVSDLNAINIAGDALEGTDAIFIER